MTPVCPALSRRPVRPECRCWGHRRPRYPAARAAGASDDGHHSDRDPRPRHDQHLAPLTAGPSAAPRVLLLAAGRLDWTEGDTKQRGRGDLRTAGIIRAELFERSATRQPIRLHDLRATEWAAT
jgi:hypothetical protein